MLRWRQEPRFDRALSLPWAGLLIEGLLLMFFILGVCF